LKKVHNIRIYKDKIYPKLVKDSIRDKILGEKLQSNDCNNNNVYQFLSLLQQTQPKDTINYKPITTDERRYAVKRAKK